MIKWQHQILGDVADIKLSNVDKLTNVNEKPIRLCNYTDVYENAFINIEKSQSFMKATCSDNEYEKFLLKKGDVAITKDSEKRNDIGVSSYIADDFKDVVLGYHLALITPNQERLDGRYLHYWINTEHSKKYFENNAGGSGQRFTLTLDSIKSFPLYLPDIQTQRTIAKVLSDLEIKIEINNKINQQLEKLAKLTYDYWFIQFDYPDENGKPYKTAGGKMVWNEKLKREIPDGWEDGKLSDLANIDTGKLDSNEFEIGGKYPFFTCAPEPLTINTYAFDDSVILIAGNNASGNFHINRYKGKFNAYQRTYVLTATSVYYMDYLFYTLKLALKRLKDKGQGSQTKFLTTPLLKDINIYKIDKQVIERFHSIMNPIFEKQTQVKFENQKHAELRDWLLPMLMNGQVKVK